ncbi:alpha/beta fold hydrolase [Parafrankia sp. CH37]|uniref:alpha/beta fold hydrolase n=1 Tax=Parafrankia sp. CH37 TaxID=683308 RepID=UPI001867586C|nr:alpha/beta fold hydrolase [Parafrankia sp. CH37]MBE3206582.1 alpha/beta fold hydrolase [Parafrankia sp. CH37]
MTEMDEQVPGRRRTFALIPGAGGAGIYWHRVVPLLRAAGHEVVAVDLPGGDPGAALPEYAAVVEAAIGATVEGRPDVVLVAQSLGGFTAPLVAELVPVRAIVFVNAMIPVPARLRAPGGTAPASPRPAPPRPSAAATAPSSTSRHTFCTTCPRTTRQRSRRILAPRMTWCSVPPVRSADGRRS